MPFQRLLSICVLISIPMALAPRSVADDDVRARFEALDDKRDSAGIVQLWRDNPAEVLAAIDSYLEGSLSKLEADSATDPALITAMEARALRGARAADEAFGTSIFADYAAAFGSWSAAEQVRFRRGQALYDTASKALRAKNFEEALAKASESLALARPLGDWWGSAMALAAMGRAHAQLGHPMDALECAGQARLIAHDLRLVQAEYANLDVLVRAADALGRKERALVGAEDGLALARQLADETGVVAFEKSVASLRAKLSK